MRKLRLLEITPLPPVLWLLKGEVNSPNLSGSMHPLAVNVHALGLCISLNLNALKCNGFTILKIETQFLSWHFPSTILLAEFFFKPSASKVSCWNNSARYTSEEYVITAWGELINISQNLKLFCDWFWGGGKQGGIRYETKDLLGKVLKKEGMAKWHCCLQIIWTLWDPAIPPASSLSWSA